MTLRTFWIIFLRILGIWLILGGLTVIPNFIGVFSFSFFGNNADENLFTVLLIIAMLLLTVGIYFIVLWLFVYKTDWLIDKLKLDKGFGEDKIDLNIQLKTVLTIASIVIGGLIFVDGFPEFCRQIFIFFQQKNVFREDPNSGWLVFYFIKSLIGYLLMTNSNLVINFINKQNKKNTTNNNIYES